jgi:ADP-heptose:LPS heptosyltransferase
LVEFLIGSWRALQRVRSLRPDVVIDCELFARASAVFSGLSGAPIKVGFHRHTQEGLYRGNFITRPVPYNPYQHISDQFVTLAEAIAATGLPLVKRASTARAFVPRMSVEPGEVERVRERLHGAFPETAGRTLVLLCPGAGLLPIRAWPLEHFARVARELSASGYAVGIIGLPRDQALAATIKAACEGRTCVDLTAFTPKLRDLVLLFHVAALLITNDGGSGHFAALSPMPTIVLFGPETPLLYGSLARNAVNVYKPPSCSPCLTAYNHRQSPCDGNNVCLKWIAPEEVLERARVLLAAGASASAMAGTPATTR